jgi:hypothetical protein
LAVDQLAKQQAAKEQADEKAKTAAAAEAEHQKAEALVRAEVQRLMKVCMTLQSEAAEAKKQQANEHMEADLVEITTAEEEAKKNFDGLVNMKEDLDDTIKALEEDKKFLADLDKKAKNEKMFIEHLASLPESIEKELAEEVFDEAALVEKELAEEAFNEAALAEEVEVLAEEAARKVAQQPQQKQPLFGRLDSSATFRPLFGRLDSSATFGHLQATGTEAVAKAALKKLEKNASEDDLEEHKVVLEKAAQKKIDAARIIEGIDIERSA